MQISTQTLCLNRLNSLHKGAKRHALRITYHRHCATKQILKIKDMLISSFIFFSLRAFFLIFLLWNQLYSLGCHEWHHFIIRQRKTWHAIHIASYLVELIKKKRDHFAA